MAQESKQNKNKRLKARRKKKRSRAKKAVAGGGHSMPNMASIEQGVMSYADLAALAGGRLPESGDLQRNFPDIGSRRERLKAHRDASMPRPSGRKRDNRTLRVNR